MHITRKKSYFVLLGVILLGLGAFFLPMLKNFQPEKGVSTVAAGDWSSFQAVALAGGTGASTDDPYRIETAEQLAYFAATYTGNTYAGKFFEITQNINLSAHFWVPMADFYGNLNGNNHAITGLTINKTYSAAAYVGFIGRSYDNATIEKLKFDGININVQTSSGTLQLGGVCGYTAATIKNCSVENSILSSSSYYTGGICGETSGGNTKIQNCYVKNSTISAASNAGGVCGKYNTSATGGSNVVMSNCYVEDCEITTSGNYSYAGGLCGTASEYMRTVEINSCYVKDCEITAGGSSSYASGIFSDAFDCRFKNSYVARNTLSGNTKYQIASKNGTECADYGTTPPINLNSIDFGKQYFGLDSNFNDGFPYLLWEKPSMTQSGTYAYTYGARLDSKSLSGESVIDNGTVVEGTLEYKDPSATPSVGTTKAVIVFTPVDLEVYEIMEFNLTISVAKAGLTIIDMAVGDELIYPAPPPMYTYGQVLGTLPTSWVAKTAEGVRVNGTATFTTPSTIPTVGTTSVAVTFTPIDTTNYNTTTGTRPIFVVKASAQISITSSHSYIYGQKLGDKTLTAIAINSYSGASVAGTIVFTDPNAMPSAGTTYTTAIFTPTDTTNYNTLTGVGVSISVAKVTPIVDTQTGVYTYAYGQQLDSKTITETADIEGTFTFKNPEETAVIGTTTVTVVFTPEDTDNYEIVEFDLEISVVKATPTIETQTGVYTYAYGQQLGLKTIIETSNVEGTFAFKNPDEMPAIGTTTVTVVFTPEDTDNYEIVEFDLEISVAKANPTFTQAGIYVYTYGQQLDSKTLEETSNVEGTFSFINPDEKPAIGTTTVTVVFTPEDTDNYEIVEFDLIISVVKATPTVDTQTGVYTYAYGQQFDSKTITETADIEGTFTFKDPEETAVIGTTTVTVVFTPEDTNNYEIVEFDLEISVVKATPTIDTQAGVYTYAYGQQLGLKTIIETSNVEGSFAFKNPDETPAIGTTTVTVVFTPEDTDNYEIVEFDLEISVAKANPTFVQTEEYVYKEGEKLDIKSLLGEDADIAGTFSFKYPEVMPKAGTTTVKVVFTPDDTEHYNVVEFDLIITVNSTSNFLEDNLVYIILGAVGLVLIAITIGSIIIYYQNKKRRKNLNA